SLDGLAEFDQFPENSQRYIEQLEVMLETPITMIFANQDRSDNEGSNQNHKDHKAILCGLHHRSDFDLSPRYQTYPGWQKSLDGLAEFDQLPENAQRYIEQLEVMLETPITMISTGPEREKLIRKGALVQEKEV
ncbi:MAG: adenylosuccinate synthetase, partial [Bacteroidota bacterium]